MHYYGAGDHYNSGDYYRGDYYRGDFLGLGKLFKGAINIGKSIIPNLIGATPIGGIVKGVAGLISTVSAGAHPSLPQPKLAALQAPAPQTGLINVGGAGPQRGLINIGGMDGGGLPAGRAMRGYHANKSTYETRGGGTSRWPQELELHEKGSVLVRNRRTNVGNARALKRALRRAHGFARLARRVMTFTHPHAGRGHFKAGKRKRA